MKKTLIRIISAAIFLTHQFQANAQPTQCKKGYFWSDTYRTCLHNYYHSCMRAYNETGATKSEILLLSRLTKRYLDPEYEFQMHNCYRLASKLPYQKELSLDCEGIDDLSSLSRLKKIKEVELKNLTLIPTLKFLKGNAVKVLSLKNFDKNLDISVINFFKNSLRVILLTSGETTTLPEVMPNLGYLQLINIKSGREWVDSIKSTGKFRDILFRRGEYYERYIKSGLSYKFFSGTDKFGQID